MKNIRLNSLFDIMTTKNVRNVVLALLVLTWAVFFGRNFLGIYYTGWDTHDLGLTFFVYFSDALHSGSVPFWNPLIQGGTFHAGLFNAGNYSPFQWPFLLLSQFISPVYAYELMIQAVSVIGATGFYLWLRCAGTKKLISLFGAHAFFLSVLMPLVGQIMFLFSLSALPWMLLVCYKAISENKENELVVYLLWAALIASFMASGYPWMNVMNFVITFLYGCSLNCWAGLEQGNVYRIKLTPALANLLTFFIGALVVIACYYAPGYYSLKFYYHLFLSDYVSPEPRLRSLAPSGSFSYRGVSDAFFASIDPRILKNNAISLTNLPVWTWGVGWVICLIFIYRKFEEDFLSKNRLWIGLLIFWLSYSGGGLIRLVPHIPLLNANRWWFIGLVYVSICMIVLAVGRLQQGIKLDWVKSTDKRSLIFGAMVSFAVLVFFSAPIYEYILVVCITVTIYYFIASSSLAQWRVGIILLMGLNMVSFVSMQHSMPGAQRSQQKVSKDYAKNYYHQIQQRNVSTTISDNHRRLGLAKEYLFNDEEWLIKKVPFSHGYNPLGNPLYWYLKDESFLERLVYMTQDVRLEKKVFRADFITDNDFANALIEDVQANTKIPTVDVIHTPEPRKNPAFQWVLNDFKLEPNQAAMKIKTNDAGYLVFNNTYFPGWKVFINGKQSQMVSINRIFQGVYVSEAGVHDVKFQFYPIILIGIFIFPLLIFLFALIFMLRDKKNISHLLTK